MKAVQSMPAMPLTGHQSWWGSVREVAWNFVLSTAIGWGAYDLAVKPAFDLAGMSPTTGVGPVVITAIFTAISFARRYVIRRWHGKREQSKRGSAIEAAVTTAVLFAAATGLWAFVMPVLVENLPWFTLDSGLLVNLVFTSFMMVLSLAVRRTSVALARRRK